MAKKQAIELSDVEVVRELLQLTEAFGNIVDIPNELLSPLSEQLRAATTPKE